MPLCAEPEHSTVGGSKKKLNIESIAIAIGYRNYRNATAMLPKRPSLTLGSKHTAHHTMPF
jgi:hypothetical protein